MAAVNQNVVPWHAVGVREALRDAAALWRDSVPARWPATRRKAVADLAQAAELLQPCSQAFRSFLPPAALALAPLLVTDKLFDVDAAAPSGFSLRQEWLLVDFGSRGAPPADVAAQLAALTEALAQQQGQHAETMAAMQAQLAAQEARANAAATKAAADAAQLLANRQAANAFQTELSLLAASPMVTEAWSLQELDVLTEVLVFHGARPASFPLLAHICPRLVGENPVLLTGDLLTVEWAAAFVFCLKRRLAEWQSFVVMVDPQHLVGFLTMMLPAKDEALAAWVVFMVEKRQVKPSTAKQYTSGSGFFDSGAR
ncbi:hypothetical protein CYMTET_37720 [Cymbomonas tetramitiformis]|uniref:Uncharacterized protein n=1 Tax=Cymbomonas tetramitiformis TaxID=36881 RepID=A0AAE0CEW2_9CHLO|nr:hypothetical protein CYMTET_37720 [Cymbomonas tetramitiformis]